jgi:putative oxidoreductase
MIFYQQRMQSLISWICQILGALIMAQTLYFKFTAAEESVEIFTKIGMEPWGRIGIGVMELIASILLIVPSAVWLGALIAAGLMSGAVFFHITIIGFSVMNDGGYLFFLALAVLICSLIILFIRRSEIPIVNKWIVTNFK